MAIWDDCDYPQETSVKYSGLLRWSVSLKETTINVSRLIRRCHVGYITRIFGTEPDNGLTQRLWYCYLYLLKGEPAQPSASRRQFDYFSVHLCMAYILQQNVITPTSDRGLSPFLTLLVEAAHISATVAVCYEPCGWVNNQYYYTLNTCKNTQSLAIHPLPESRWGRGLPPNLVKSETRH